MNIWEYFYEEPFYAFIIICSACYLPSLIVHALSTAQANRCKVAMSKGEINDVQEGD